MASQHIASASMTGTPASVTVDVYDASNPTAKLATIPNSDVKRVGTETTYTVDLRNNSVVSSLGLPADGSHEMKDFVLIWKDDVTSFAVAERVLGTASRESLDRTYRKETPIYATAPVPTRGITQAVINDGKPSYIKVELSPNVDDFSSPAETYYEVFKYDSLGRVESKTPATAAPNP